MANFGAILDKPASEISRPKPLPVGTYLFVIQGLPRMDKSSKKQTEFVEYTCKVLQAGEDVDAEELGAMGGIEDKAMKLTFYLTEDSVYRLKDFLYQTLKLEEKATLRQSIEEAMGTQFLGTVTHEPSQDGESVFARLNKTAAVE